MSDSAAWLATPLQFLKGVGPRKAADFARAALHSVEDLSLKETALTDAGHFPHT